MAKKSINKSDLVRQYLAQHPEKGPTAIAQQINDDKGIKITSNFVATVKTKLKKTSGSTATASTPVKKKPAAVRAKSAPTKPAPAAVSAAGLVQHIANLKAAAQRLGKDEAKRIIDLF